jgi:hypothetical protein
MQLFHRILLTMVQHVGRILLVARTGQRIVGLGTAQFAQVDRLVQYI